MPELRQLSKPQLGRGDGDPSRGEILHGNKRSERLEAQVLVMAAQQLDAMLQRCRGGRGHTGGSTGIIGKNPYWKGKAHCSHRASLWSDDKTI